MFQSSKPAALALCLLLSWGCNKAPAIPEPDYASLGTTKEEQTQIKEYLDSSDSKEVMKGLSLLQKNPKLTLIYLDKVIALSETSKDPKISQLATDLLAKIKS